MFNLILKTTILYVLIIFAMRLMGKKQAGELQPYELVITLLIAEVASVPITSPGTPLIYGLAPAITLMLLYYFISYLTLKNHGLRKLLCGTPKILIHNGVIQLSELKKQDYSVSDLMEQLRYYGNTSIEQIHYAILENNGRLSVLPFDKYCPVTADTLKVEQFDTEINAVIISDGYVHKLSMMRYGLDDRLLQKRLKEFGYRGAKEILLMTINDDKKIFIQDKNGKTKVIGGQE